VEEDETLDGGPKIMMDLFSPERQYLTRITLPRISTNGTEDSAIERYMEQTRVWAKLLLAVWKAYVEQGVINLGEESV
jgi:hypothetical protein